MNMYNMYEKGMLVIPNPRDTLVIEAITTAPFNVKSAEITFSPRSGLSEDRIIHPVSLIHGVKNRGSHIEPNISYEQPKMELIGKDESWPSSLHEGMFGFIRYNFVGDTTDHRFMIVDFANRHLDPSKEESCILSPDGYKFDRLQLNSRFHPDNEPSSSQDLNVRLIFDREENGFANLRLVMAVSPVIEILKLSQWYLDLARNHGQSTIAEVPEGKNKYI